MALLAQTSDDEEPVNVSSSPCVLMTVWSVGNAAHRLGDPHQGAPPSPGLQHPPVPQG